MSSPSTQRGLILFEQGRFPEAEKYFREALAGDPNDPHALYYLAVCQLNQGKPKDALGTIDSALALAPEADGFHAFRALVLVELHKFDEARRSADEAIRLDPDSDFAFVALGAIHLARHQWSEAEKAARRALEINPENSVASNQLAHALRLQNRLAESADQSAYMLEQDPEDADTHATAGWIALQRGQIKPAEQHFLEALRLSPNHEGAREGLKEAFRARSPLYRAYLNCCFFMQRYTAGNQWLIIIGLIVGIRIVRAVFPPPIALLIMVLYFLLVLWVHVARDVGNFQVLFDRFARHALNFAEKLEAWFVGGAVILGLPLFVVGIFAHIPLLIVLGATLIGAAFPMAYVFTNKSLVGRLLFGASALFILVVGGANLLEILQNRSLGDWVAGATGAAGLVVVAVTWLCNIKALNRRF